jgi:hypothetical protein
MFSAEDDATDTIRVYDGCSSVETRPRSRASRPTFSTPRRLPRAVGFPKKNRNGENCSQPAAFEVVAAAKPHKSAHNQHPSSTRGCQHMVTSFPAECTRPTSLAGTTREGRPRTWASLRAFRFPLPQCVHASLPLTRITCWAYHLPPWAVVIPRRFSSSAAFLCDRPASSAKTGRNASARSAASR